MHKYYRVSCEVVLESAVVTHIKYLLRQLGPLEHEDILHEENMILYIKP